MVYGIRSKTPGERVWVQGMRWVRVWLCDGYRYERATAMGTSVRQVWVQAYDSTATGYTTGTGTGVCALNGNEKESSAAHTRNKPSSGTLQ